MFVVVLPYSFIYHRIENDHTGDVVTTTFISSIIGKSKAPRLTLVLFANNNELRVGGGFVGTVGILLGNGREVSIRDIRSVYYYDHRIQDKEAFISAPEYIRGLTTEIGVRDSLLDQDPKSNLRRATALFQRETGETVDNVVVITPEILKKVLEITGPISLPSYNMVISSENILSTLQLEVESGKDKQEGRDPKNVLGELAEGILNEVGRLPLQKMGKVSQLVRSYALGEGYDGYYVLNLGMSREIASNDHTAALGDNNAFLIAEANVAASKTSSVIRQEHLYEFTLSDKGIEELKTSVQREHTSPQKFTYIDPRDGNSNALINMDDAILFYYLPGQSTALQGADPTSRLEDSVGARTIETFQSHLLLGPLQKGLVSASFRLGTRYDMSRRIEVSKRILYQYGSFPRNIKIVIHAPSGYRVDTKDSILKKVDSATLMYKGLQVGAIALTYEFIKK